MNSKLTKVLSDLQVQAMMFDLDIDIEALSLVPKSNYKEEFWVTRWKEKQDAADLDNRTDYDLE